MKKIYLNPEIKVVKIETVHMIAESIGVGANEYGLGDAVLSRRRGNFWDDEDEDEEEDY